MARDIPPANGDIQGQEAMREQLWPRLIQHVRNVLRDEEQVRWMEAMGRFWKSIRNEVGLSRKEVARRMGMVSESELAFFENGLVSPEDLPPAFIRTLAMALGRRDAVMDFVADQGGSVVAYL